MSTASIAGILGGVCPTQRVGQQAFTANGSFVVPYNVYFISGVAVGGGGGAKIGLYHAPHGGGGGALSYMNGIPVTPGETLTITVGSAGVTGEVTSTSGGDSIIKRSATALVHAGGGVHGAEAINRGGYVLVGTGGAGGPGGKNDSVTFGHGGGGAGGYSGAGGTGGRGSSSSGEDGTSGAGGGGGGGGGSKAGTSPAGDGGSVGLLGEGASGAGGRGGSTSVTPYYIGLPGDDGSATGSTYGGGAGGVSEDYGGGQATQGGVRIMWGGGRSYPSNAGDV